MLTLPELELEELPMNLDPLGRLWFCAENDEAVLASFALGIKADSTEEWEITSIHIQTQALRPGTEMFRRFAQHLESEDFAKAEVIRDHIDAHLQDAREAAEYEAKAPYFAGTLPYCEVA